MVEGLNPGESLVIPKIEHLFIGSPDEQYQYNYGDQTIQMGWYLGVLATEHRLLANKNQATARTEQELYHAMKAFERLDLNAETQPMYTDPINGIAATTACNCDTFDFNINKTGAAL